MKDEKLKIITNKDPEIVRKEVEKFCNENKVVGKKQYSKNTAFIFYLEGAD